MFRGLIVTIATYQYRRGLQSGIMHVIMYLADSTSYFTCCKTIKILSGVTGFKAFSCRESLSKGNSPSNLESKVTEHMSILLDQDLSIC